MRALRAGLELIAADADLVVVTAVESPHPMMVTGSGRAGGPAICRYADDVDARGIVMGSRGHGGLRRAVLGSVSDHVVRRATCPVVVTN